MVNTSKKENESTKSPQDTNKSTNTLGMLIILISNSMFY